MCWSTHFISKKEIFRTRFKCQPFFCVQSNIKAVSPLLLFRIARALFGDGQAVGLEDGRNGPGEEANSEEEREGGEEETAEGEVASRLFLMMEDLGQSTQTEEERDEGDERADSAGKEEGNAG